MKPPESTRPTRPPACTDAAPDRRTDPVENEERTTPPDATVPASAPARSPVPNTLASTSQTFSAVPDSAPNRPESFAPPLTVILEMRWPPTNLPEKGEALVPIGVQFPPVVVGFRSMSAVNS